MHLHQCLTSNPEHWTAVIYKLVSQMETYLRSINAPLWCTGWSCGCWGGYSFERGLHAIQMMNCVTNMHSISTHAQVQTCLPEQVDWSQEGLIFARLTCFVVKWGETTTFNLNAYILNPCQVWLESLGSVVLQVKCSLAVVLTSLYLCFDLTSLIPWKWGSTYIHHRSTSLCST